LARCFHRPTVAPRIASGRMAFGSQLQRPRIAPRFGSSRPTFGSPFHHRPQHLSQSHRLPQLALHHPLRRVRIV
jgi:hypothetical protein